MFDDGNDTYLRVITPAIAKDDDSTKKLFEYVNRQLRHKPKFQAHVGVSSNQTLGKYPMQRSNKSMTFYKIPKEVGKDLMDNSNVDVVELLKAYFDKQKEAA